MSKCSICRFYIWEWQDTITRKSNPGKAHVYCNDLAKLGFDTEKIRARLEKTTTILFRTGPRAKEEGPPPPAL